MCVQYLKLLLWLIEGRNSDFDAEHKSSCKQIRILNISFLKPYPISMKCSPTHPAKSVQLFQLIYDKSKIQVPAEFAC